MLKNKTKFVKKYKFLMMFNLGELEGNDIYLKTNYDNRGWRKQYKYKLENGIPTEISAGDIPGLVLYYKRGNIVNGASRFADTFNWKVNMDDIYPDNGNGGQATIK